MYPALIIGASNIWPLIVLPRVLFAQPSWLNLGYCWFSRDVMAAILVIKNKNISLVWELKSIFMFFEIIFILLITNMAAMSRGCRPSHVPLSSLKPEFVSILSRWLHLSCSEM